MDDVITAGTAIREACQIIHTAGGTVAGVVAALDRQEQAPESTLKTVEQLTQDLSVPVKCIVNLTDVKTILTANHNSIHTRSSNEINSRVELSETSHGKFTLIYSGL